MTKDRTQTILVIEDEEDILHSIKEFLQSEGYNVLIATNGLEALNLLNKLSMPNLIILDMKMPIMNGWIFAKEFHEKFTKRAPIVVLTAAGDAEQRAKDIQAVGFIAKPFDLEDLLLVVKQYAT